jgi:hypothetical protein
MMLIRLSVDANLRGVLLPLSDLKAQGITIVGICTRPQFSKNELQLFGV